MFAGILQKMNIIHMSESRLVLRELPLLDWLVVLVILLSAVMMWIANITISAVIALGVALFMVLQAHVRLVVFTIDPNLMQVLFQSPLRTRITNEISLHQISRAYLKKDDLGGTQIILVQTDGEEMGLSVYSKDLRDWKEDIVIAINAILHNAHKDDPNREGMV
jgi:hypothetical protein